MALVLDAWFTIAIALDEENTPGAGATLEQIASEGVMVPALWRFEWPMNC